MQSREAKSVTTDAQIITSITSNPEATMSAVASNSIGKVIVELKESYFGANPSEQQLEKEYKNCVAELMQLKVSDFVKPNDSDKTKAAITTEIEKELKPLVNFIITKTTEAPSALLDVVTLYLPVKSKPESKEVELKEVQYLMPLKIVLPLLWKAYNDNEKFTQNYVGTPEERLQQAVMDKPLRLLTFFRCLQRAKIGICHQGVRNELILLLNKTYRGIDLIEDAAAALQYFLREQINTQFWQMYNNKELAPEQRKVLTKALFTWMSESNATELLKVIDTDKHILKNLNAIFIKQGSNPKKLTVQSMAFGDYVEHALQHIDFATDSKRHSNLTFAKVILSDDEIEGQPDRNAAIKTLQQWIKADYQLEKKSHERKLATFYSMFNAYKLLMKNQSLLILSGYMTAEKVQESFALFNHYFCFVYIDFYFFSFFFCF